MINREYLDDQARKTLTKSFPKGKPFPHLVLHDFFSPAKIKKVRQELLKQGFNFKESDLFRFHQTPDLRNSPNKTLREFAKFFSSKEFCQYISKITRTHVNKADMSGFIYSATDHLLPHDDRLAGRKIAYVVNLSQGFKKRDGGALSFFETKNNKPTKITQSFTPSFNTLYLFKVSPRSFHQVDEVLSSKKRFTLAGWFHG